ncbi:MAG: DUF2975 domain-containing protein [Limisphaerales bacterium]
MLKNKYLLFINKKYLTNGIDGCILCAMNSNEMVPETSRRLNRVRTVIWVIKILIGLAVVCVVVFNLIFLSSLVGWTDISPRSISWPPFSSYSSARTIPSPLLILGFIRVGLFFAGALVLSRLLRFFASGSFFTAKNINCIKWLGCLVVSDWVIVKFLQVIGSRALMIGFDDFAKLAIGFLVVLIAWIMDEGRKIQEEQELTV